MPEDTLKEGAVLCGGRFIVKSLLGTGTEGTALLCTDSILDENVVCKVAQKPEFNSRFLKQYKILRKLSYVKQLVDVHGYFLTDDGKSVLCLRPTKGKYLHSLPSTAPFLLKLRILHETIVALAALHQVDFVHGDVNRGNVIYLGDDVMLIDPESELLGSSRTRGASIDPKPVDDHEGLIYLTNKLFSKDELKDLSEINEALRGRIGMTSLSDLASKVYYHLYITRVEDLGDAGDKHVQDLASKELKFLRLWKLRADIIKRTLNACANIRDQLNKGDRRVLKLFGIRGVQEALKREKTSVDAPKSELKHILFGLETNEKDCLYIEFYYAVHPFYREWPPEYLSDHMVAK